MTIDASLAEIEAHYPPPHLGARPAHLKRPNRLEQIGAIRDRIAHLEGLRSRGARLHELRCLRAALEALGDRRRRRRWDPPDGWTHLGDEVYAIHYGDDVWLCTPGYTNMIAINREVFIALAKYLGAEVESL